MAGQVPFVLSRATPSDMEKIVDLQYDCFPDFIRRVFMGVDSKNDLSKVTKTFIEKMQSDPNDVWIQVVDKESGQVIAASNWKIYINGETHGGVKDDPPEGLEGEWLEKSKEFMAKINEARAKSMPGPFVRMPSMLPSFVNITTAKTVARSTHLFHACGFSSTRCRGNDAEMGLRHCRSVGPSRLD